jgi:hypothetical protein
LDQAFLKALQQKGIAVKSDQWAIDLAHSTCDLLKQRRHGQRRTENADEEDQLVGSKATDFGGLAIYAYCKDKLPAGTGASLRAWPPHLTPIPRDPQKHGASWRA